MVIIWSWLKRRVISIIIEYDALSNDENIIIHLSFKESAMNRIICCKRISYLAV
jgi:hypothetical protein